ncbi:MAG: hypothetical protein ABEI97_04000 [Candidatus Nanohaloarchaea archaeon]
MAVFTFVASLDSKGRLTVPAAIRKNYALEDNDTFRVTLQSITVEEVDIDDAESAMDRLQEFDDVISFSYRDGVLEVVHRD